jgi:hypothetical protein
VLERAYAATGPSSGQKDTPPGNAANGQQQDPSVEQSRPENPAGEGSQGPDGPREGEPGKNLGGVLFERGDRLATALEKYKTNGSVFSTNGKH